MPCTESKELEQEDQDDGPDNCEAEDEEEEEEELDGYEYPPVVIRSFKCFLWVICLYSLILFKISLCGFAVGT